MARHPTSDFTVTIAGKSEYVDARAFIEAIRDALDALSKVDETVSSVEGGSLQWQIIDATSNSPLTMKLKSVAKSVADFRKPVLDAFFDGLQELESAGTMPRNFSPPAIRAVKRLADHFEDGISAVTFATRNRRFSPTSRLIENLAKLAQDPRISEGESTRPDYFEYGQIDGTVENLISHNQLYFSLYDALSGARVRCDFTADMSESIRAAWRKRVTVGGRIRFGGDGRPKEVSVDDVAPKEGRDSLPQFKGFYIDITGGVESSQHVRELRDDA